MDDVKMNLADLAKHIAEQLHDAGCPLAGLALVTVHPEGSVQMGTAHAPDGCERVHQVFAAVQRAISAEVGIAPIDILPKAGSHPS